MQIHVDDFFLFCKNPFRDRTRAGSLGPQWGQLEPRQSQGQGQGHGQDHENVRRRRAALQALTLTPPMTLTLPWFIFPHWGPKELARLR